MDKDKDKMAGIPAADEQDPKPVGVDKVNSDALTAENSGKSLMDSPEQKAWEPVRKKSLA